MHRTTIRAGSYFVITHPCLGLGSQSPWKTSRQGWCWLKMTMIIRFCVSLCKSSLVHHQLQFMQPSQNLQCWTHDSSLFVCLFLFLFFTVIFKFLLLGSMWYVSTSVDPIMSITVNGDKTAERTASKPHSLVLPWIRKIKLQCETPQGSRLQDRMLCGLNKMMICWVI